MVPSLTWFSSGPLDVFRMQMHCYNYCPSLVLHQPGFTECAVPSISTLLFSIRVLSCACYVSITHVLYCLFFFLLSESLISVVGLGVDSTASLILVTGVLAPLLEETVFRGFFLTSLTKWYSCLNFSWCIFLVHTYCYSVRG